MLKDIQRANERGQTKKSWLLSYHSFSFGSYQNPKRNNFGKLCTLNEDTIQPDTGFDPHPHEDMEIVTVVLQGQLQHQDNLGHQHTIHADEVQVMSAGTGIQHSEKNPSATEPVHLLQIWVAPNQKCLQPHYAQKSFSDKLHINHWVCLVSPDGWNDSLIIQQDAYFYLVEFEQGYATNYKLKQSDNGLFCYLLEGKIELAGEKLSKGDSIGLTDIAAIEINMLQKARFLCIEVPV